MKDEDDRPLPAALRAAFEPAFPPAGFAERVVAGGHAPRAEVDRVRVLPRWWPLVAATAGVAAAVVFLWARSDSRESSGRAQLDERTSIALSDRGVVVGEPGSELRWQIEDDGRTTVEQTSGRAFYRVDPGPAFNVVTPHGTATVTGTCFAVEVNPMSQSLVKGLVAGAALGAAVAVTVYEGGVVLAHEGESVALTPGQRGIADADGRVRRDDGDESSEPGGDHVAAAGIGARADAASLHAQAHARAVDQLRADRQARDAEIERLRAEVERLGGDPGKREKEAGHKPDAERCSKANTRMPECDFVEPDQDTLLEMAKCATVRVDSPGFLFSGGDDVRLPADFIEQAKLDPGERASLEKAMSEFKRAYISELRDMLVEAGGGTPETAKEMPETALGSVVEGLLSEDEIDDALRRVSHERAGIAEPPGVDAELSLAERYVRHTAELGNALEAAVGRSLGPERAHELRTLHNGWRGSTSVHSGNCEELPN